MAFVTDILLASLTFLFDAVLALCFGALIAFQPLALLTVLNSASVTYALLAFFAFFSETIFRDLNTMT